MILKNCKVFLGDGEFHDCELRFGKTIDGAGKFEGEGLDLGGAYVVPGYVDIHSHGCMNRDFSDGDPEAMAVASSYYAQNGHYHDAQGASAHAGDGLREERGSPARRALRGCEP